MALTVQLVALASTNPIELKVLYFRLPFYFEMLLLSCYVLRLMSNHI